MNLPRERCRKNERLASPAECQLSMLVCPATELNNHVDLHCLSMQLMV